MVRCALFAHMADAGDPSLDLHDRLDPALARVHHAYGDDLSAPPLLVRGDEIQLLLRTAAGAFDLADLLADALRPLRLRFGVGRGKLAPPSSAVPGAHTGPVLFRAREAMERTRGRTGGTIRFVGFGPYTATLDVLGDCGLAIAAAWTPAQRESVRALLVHGTQRAAAAALNRGRSTVTRNLQRALASQYLGIRQHLRELLASIPEHVDFVADGE